MDLPKRLFALWNRTLKFSIVEVDPRMLLIKVMKVGQKEYLLFQLYKAEDLPKIINFYEGRKKIT